MIKHNHFHGLFLLTILLPAPVAWGKRALIQLLHFGCHVLGQANAFFVLP